MYHFRWPLKTSDMAPRRPTKKIGSPSRRRRRTSSDIWAELDFSVSDQSKIDITNSVLSSIHSRDLLYKDYRPKSTRDAVHQAIRLHIRTVAQDFQSHLANNPEKIVAFFRKLVVHNRHKFMPPEAEDADNEGGWSNISWSNERIWAWINSHLVLESPETPNFIKLWSSCVLMNANKSRTSAKTSCPVDGDIRWYSGDRNK